MINIFKLVKEIKEAGDTLGNLLRERVEIEKRLQEVQDPELIKSIREDLTVLDVQFEELRFQHQSNLAIANLLTGLLNAGKAEDVKILLGDDALESGIFKVLEIRKGKSTGTVRAWCEEAGGKKAVVYAKHEAAKLLTSAVGKQVEVVFKKLDKGYFAVKVSLSEFENNSKDEKKELIKTLYQS
ncbi:hypothetical protein [Desulfolucanica intricata]|uniref:hypothetical protein n=1 Tax=Desulfolucanica intricata TaxID=1285191 RepID=UPI00082DDD93|nr:hypothetical protein [Desulfolucanica intricata]